MATVITLHSIHGGTGKTLCAANLGTLLALRGLRVGLIDVALQAPGLHVPFDLQDHEIRYTLNDYLWGRCDIKAASHDVTRALAPNGRLETRDLPQGRAFLVPASLSTAEIARIAREPYDVGLLNDSIRALVDALELDVVILDTSPGLSEEALLSMSVADILLVLMRLDQQDFLSTSLSLELSYKLEIARTELIINKMPPALDSSAARTKMEHTYRCPVAAVLPHAAEIVAMASSGLLVARHPTHPVSHQLQAVTDRLLR